MLVKTICIALGLALTACGTEKNEEPLDDSDELVVDAIQHAYEPTTEHNGISFVWVPPGKKMIGSNSSQAHRREQPQVLFELEQGFYIGRTEITANQYLALFPNATGLYAEGQHPVRVVWSDAKAFCNKLNDLRISSGKKTGVFRLPYEQEWEYIATYGRPTKDDWWPTHSRYPDKFLSEYENYDINYENDGVYEQNTVIDVQQLKPNPLGVHDILGNVSEWCEGYFAEDVVAMLNKAYDKEIDFGSDRPMRGGDYLDSIKQLRSSIRYPRNDHQIAGFRVLFDPLADLPSE